MASKRAMMFDALEQASQNSELMGQVRAAVEARNEGASASLAALFKLGQIGRDIKENPAGLPWYPERIERGRAFDLFEKTFYTSPGKLRQAILIDSIYTAEQLEMFLTHKSETYEQMTPEHLRVITRLEADLLPGGLPEEEGCGLIEGADLRRRNGWHVEQARLRFAAHMFGHSLKHGIKLIEFFTDGHLESDLLNVQFQRFPALVLPDLQFGGPMRCSCHRILHGLNERIPDQRRRRKLFRHLVRQDQIVAAACHEY